MTGFGWPKWDTVFVPDGSLLESILRVTLVYFALVVLFRVILRRQRGGSVGLGDLMVLVLISECVSQALNSQFNSVPNGVVAAGTLLFWNYVTDSLSYRWDWLHKLVQAEPLRVVRDGRPIPENMRQERMRDDELACELRKQGVDDVAKVKAAFIEAEGDTSVIPAEGGGPAAASGPPHPPEFDAALRHFLDAARRLHEAASWYDAQESGVRSQESGVRSQESGVRGQKTIPFPTFDPRSPSSDL
ncbi:MAG TPA: YetF domain-containing protein [Fimbriiglobus sp.]|nr:YetF domain-containing protein [Fimbriiglobus sp.]